MAGLGTHDGPRDLAALAPEKELAYTTVIVRSRGHRKILVVRAIRHALGILPAVKVAADAMEHAMEEAADGHAAARLGDPTVVASALSKAALSGLEAPAGAMELTSGSTSWDSAPVAGAAIGPAVDAVGRASRSPRPCSPSSR